MTKFCSNSTPATLAIKGNNNVAIENVFVPGNNGAIENVFVPGNNVAIENVFVSPGSIVLASNCDLKISNIIGNCNIQFGPNSSLTTLDGIKFVADANGNVSVKQPEYPYISNCKTNSFYHNDEDEDTQGGMGVLIIGDNFSDNLVSVAA
jgi:hypothetical protein